MLKLVSWISYDQLETVRSESQNGTTVNFKWANHEDSRPLIRHLSFLSSAVLAAAAAVVAAVLPVVAGHTAAACIAAAAAASALSCLFLYHRPFLCLTHCPQARFNQLMFFNPFKPKRRIFFGRAEAFKLPQTVMAVINQPLSEFSHSNVDPITTSTHLQSSILPNINFAPLQLIGSLHVRLDTFLQNPQNGWTCSYRLRKTFQTLQFKKCNIINRSLNSSSEPLPFAVRRSSSRRCCSKCFCWRFSASRDQWLSSASDVMWCRCRANKVQHRKVSTAHSPCKSQAIQPETVQHHSTIQQLSFFFLASLFVLSLFFFLLPSNRITIQFRRSVHPSLATKKQKS